MLSLLVLGTQYWSARDMLRRVEGRCVRRTPTKGCAKRAAVFRVDTKRMIHCFNRPIVQLSASNTRTCVHQGRPRFFCFVSFLGFYRCVVYIHPADALRCFGVSPLVVGVLERVVVLKRVCMCVHTQSAELDSVREVLL